MKKLKALYRGELTKRVEYFFKKKLGYYKYKKKPNTYLQVQNLNLLNKDFTINLPKDYQYDFLNNYIDLRSLEFKNHNQKRWIYENLNKYGDVKNIWEVNRLQFLLPLALNKEYALIARLLNNWQINNNYNYGINWYSNLEVAIRAISIYFTFELVNNKISFNFNQCLYEHGVKIYQEIDYSAKCIPNNHVYGEATALLLLGNAFNKQIWISKAEKIINKFSYLVNDEGISIEGSISYHFFIIQMLIIINFLFPSMKIENKINNAILFLKNVTKPDNSIINLGDNDEGFFYNPFWKKDINTFLDNLDFFNKDLKINYYKQEFINYYDYKILNNKDIFLFFNAQQEKYHAHSDNLAIELCINDINILTDSGTYVYNNNPILRNYFRSSFAHNTISLNGLHSQAVGSFRWIDPPLATIKGNKEKLIGTLKKGKNLFTREIEISKNKIVITDTIKTKLDYELNFHFDKLIKLKKISNNKYIDNNLYIEFFGENIDIILTESLLSEKYNKIIKRNNIKIKSMSNNKIITIIGVL